MARFRATATVTWDFLTDLPYNEALDLAKQQAQAIIRTGHAQNCIRHYIQDLNDAQQLQGGEVVPDLDVRAVLRLDRVKEKSKKTRIGEFLPDDVLPYITREDSKRSYVVDGVEYPVRMNSHRYFAFHQSLGCAACGLVGTKMLLEHHPADKSPHFNLYAEEDGNLILMTKDHILAKSMGGEDRHSNYQTMCILCNNLKGSSNLTLDGIRALREIYNENKSKLTRKNLHSALELARKNLERKPSEFAAQPIVQSVCSALADLNIWRTPDGLIAKTAYERLSGEHIACIRKDSPVWSVSNEGGVVVAGFGRQTFVVSGTLVRFREQTVSSFA